MKKNLFFIGLFISAIFVQAQNNALSFSEKDDFVAIPSIAGNLSAFTIEAWINPTSIPAIGNMAILSTNSWDIIDGGSIHFQFENELVVLSVATGVSPWPGMKTKLTTGVWQHIAVTYDLTNSLVCFYLNGVLDNSITQTLTKANISAAQIGAWNNSRNFNGAIDELRIWNVARTASEIATNMNKPIDNPTTLPHLLAYYPFNQGTGGGDNTGLTTLTDASASGFNGTLSYFVLTGTTSNWITGKIFIYPPVINSFTPEIGPVGSSVTINGSRFNAVSANNIVFFGATRATVIAASATSLTVTVPAGANYQLISVTDISAGLSAYSHKPFITSFSCGALNSGSFADKVDFIPGSASRFSAISDLDGDGFTDIVVVGNSGVLSVFRNTSIGGIVSFADKVEFATGSNSLEVAVGDLNGDGKPDLAVANNNDSTISVLLNTSVSGTVSFAPKVDFAAGKYSNCVAIGDLDGDGKPDLVVGIISGVVVLRNISTAGTVMFAAKVEYPGIYSRGVSIGDLDGDGKPEVAALDGANVSVMRNTSINGIISFEPKMSFAIGGSSKSVTMGDLDGDGKPDLVTSSFSAGTIAIWRNTCTNGIISFAAKIEFKAGQSISDVSIGDLDSDGKPDLAVASEMGPAVSVLRNTCSSGIISFASMLQFASVTIGGSVSIGDINNDGKPDLVALSMRDFVCIFRNKGNVPAINAFYTTTYCGKEFSIVPADGTNGNVPSGTTYTWPEPTVTGGLTGGKAGSGTIIAATLINLTETPQTATYTVTPASDCGAGIPFTITVTVNPRHLSITSLTPASGQTGSIVTISGIEFSTTPANNIVYFGAVKAIVNASTYTSISVTVPAGAGSVVPVSVALNNEVNNPLVNNHIAYTTTCSTPTFNITNSPNLDYCYIKKDVAFSTPGNVPQGVFGDFNGDGKADMVFSASRAGDSVVVMLGNGDGTFAAEVKSSAGITPYTVAIGDFNGDGKLDLATAGGSNNASILLGKGDGTFVVAGKYAVGTAPASVSVGDFNGDGIADLATGNFASGNVSILLGTGDGTLTAAVNYAGGTSPLSMAMGDINGDGKVDLATANNFTKEVFILLGMGDGTFVAAGTKPVGTRPYSIAIGDFNRDGKGDLVIANEGSSTVSILLGRGDVNLVGYAVNYPVGGQPLSVAIGDFNGDGKEDLATANWGDNNVTILQGNGDGTFTNVVNFPTVARNITVCAGDFNGDGKADLATFSDNTPVACLLLNTTISITTKAVTGIGITTATGNAKITDMGVITSVTACGVCWNTVGTPTIANNKVDNGATSSPGDFAASITGLIANTTYYVRAYATNTAGTSYGKEVSFTTLQPAPFKIISFAPSTGATGTVVTLKGIGFSTIPAENIVYFGAVRASVSASTYTTITVSVPVGAGSVVPVSVTVNGSVALSTTSSTPTFTLTNSPNLDLVYTKKDFSLGFIPNSVATGDFNGDGITDLVSSNPIYTYLSILLGVGNGTFAAPVNYSIEDNIFSVAVGDFNGDGKTDMVIIYPGRIVFFRGIGDGTFTTTVTYLAGTIPVSMAIGDFNGDGMVDIATSNSSVVVFWGNGNGSFESKGDFPTGTNPYSIVVGDFNGDGIADLATSNYGSNNVSVLLGSGTGTFAATINYEVGLNPLSLVVGDFNRDGKADLATANQDSDNVSVLFGTGNGGFGTAVNLPVGDTPESIAIGDFNGDGIADLAIANWISSDVSILQGIGDGTFADAVNIPTGIHNAKVLVGDFNGDGNTDLTTISGDANNASVLLNTAMGITTNAVTGIGTTTAAGNGNITGLGSANPTAYGVCWNISGTPTTADDKADNGATSAIGAFTSSIIGLKANTKYYVRAYAVNTSGTYYGNEVNFTTSFATAVENVAVSTLSLYPNPAADGFTIDAGEHSTLVYIYDMNGVVVLTQQATGKSYIDITSLKPGIYVIKTNGVFTKLVKK